MIPRYLLALFMFVFSIITFIGCQTIVEAPIDPVVNTGNDVLFLKVGGGAVAQGDSVLTEQGLIVHFSAFSNGPAIVRWQWLIDSYTFEGQTIKYAFNDAPGVVKTIKLLGTDNANTVHEKTFTVIIMSSLDGQRDVQWMSSTPNGQNYDIVLAFRNKLQYIASNEWNTWEPPTWTKTPIPNSDISYNIVNNTLVAATNGNYVVVRRTVAPGQHKIAVGKQDVWGTYNDETIVEYAVLTGGSVMIGDSTSVQYPGYLGDSGLSPVIRWDFLADRALMYINHKTTISGITPFIRFVKATGDTSAVINGSVVTDHANWAVYTVMFDSLPSNGLIEWYFGNTASTPTVSAAYMSESAYYSQSKQLLRAILTQVTLSKRVNGAPNWTAKPVR